MADTERLLEYLPEIEEALARNKPVVALESTIITHGMPFPQNRDTAMQVEQEVLDHGAIPATIAILDGKVKIGLSDDDLDRLAQEKEVMKLSRADFAFAVSQSRTGSTTVAATMMAAQMAGIQVFATGGIGGVHKGAETSFDISADLIELARSHVIVVSAGTKAILDIAKTLEVLETNGVPVVTYENDELPAFWSRKSGIPSPLRLDSAGEIADFWKTRRDLRQYGGMLIANPVPKNDEIPASEMAKYIEIANVEAQKAGISGKAVTPWMLGRILELTDGKSLSTNIALVMNNARLAAQIAVAIAKTSGAITRKIGFTG